jgi:hypothetical protein
MSAQRDADGFAAPDSDGNPEVIDVAWDSVGFRDERDRHARDVHKFSMSEGKIWVIASLAASMWQASKVIVYSAAWEEPIINLPLLLPLFSFPVRERQ